MSERHGIYGGTWLAIYQHRRAEYDRRQYQCTDEPVEPKRWPDNLKSRVILERLVRFGTMTQWYTGNCPMRVEIDEGGLVARLSFPVGDDDAAAASKKLKDAAKVLKILSSQMMEGARKGLNAQEVLKGPEWRRLATLSRNSPRGGSTADISRAIGLRLFDLMELPESDKDPLTQNAAEALIREEVGSWDGPGRKAVDDFLEERFFKDFNHDYNATKKCVLQGEVLTVRR